MLSIRRFLLSILLISAAYAALHSQVGADGSDAHFREIYNYTREKVDVKQKLNNGAYYENPYYNAIGHPFLNDGNFRDGAVVFRNSTFDHVSLKYDIFHQQLSIHSQQVCCSRMRADARRQSSSNELHFRRNSLFCQVER